MTNRTEAVRQGEERLTKELRRALKPIVRTIAKQEKEAHKAEEEEAALDWTPVAIAARTELTAVATAGARDAVLRLGFDDSDEILDQSHSDAIEWASERSAELVGKRWNEDGELEDNPDAGMAIDETLRDEIRAQVTDALAAGDSAAELASKLDAFSDTRAEVIARTEIIRANNQGHLAAFRASGVVSQKEWSTAEDEDECEDCEANADAGPIDLDDDFPSGDDAAPCHPNCRCVVTPIVDEDAEDEDESDDEDDSEADDDE